MSRTIFIQCGFSHRKYLYEKVNKKYNNPKPIKNTVPFITIDVKLLIKNLTYVNML
jgi:hypothetical protein